MIDRDAITRALVNLIDNAMKYSGESKEILVNSSRAGGFATVAVIDHGIGVQREDRERIFEKFYRGGSSLLHDVKGSGLGLTIVKHIVDAHHGQIKVESKPGSGSTFTVHLPIDNGMLEHS
jgi:signal transduction histidine kinase